MSEVRSFNYDYSNNNTDLAKNNNNPNLAQSVIPNKTDDITIQIQQNQPDFAFYLFVNPTSGGNRAAQLVNLEAEKVTFHLDQDYQNGKKPNTQSQTGGKLQCEVYFYNMADEKVRRQGMAKLKKDQMSGIPVRVIVGGGDGTVMWVVDELVLATIVLSNCPIGIIPFGTGNDFARVTGWGGDSPPDVLGQNLSYLKKLVKQWTIALVEDFDIWEIKIITYEHGYFQKVKKHSKGFDKKIIKITDPITAQISNVKVFKQKMCNYFSFGVDARIGWGFDKSRTQSALGNKCVYCLEGFKKMFITTPSLNNTLYSMEVCTENENSIVHQADGQGNLDIDVQYNDTKEVLFTTRQGKYQPILNGPQSDTNQRVHELKGDPVNLLCLNIPSYSGGSSDVWAECQGKIALQDPTNSKFKVQDKFSKQNFGDGQLEFVCFQSIMGLANERFLKGQASRCAQGSGPFLFKFKQDDPKVNPMRQYLQIDGEYFMVYHPQFVKIRRTKSIPDGKIQVLVERKFREKSLPSKQG